MKNEIRRQTALIIRRNGEYLVGRILGSEELRWSYSPHDACRTRNREKAEALARKVGGITMLFNPAAGQLRIL